MLREKTPLRRRGACCASAIWTLLLVTGTLTNAASTGAAGSQHRQAATPSTSAPASMAPVCAQTAFARFRIASMSVGKASRRKRVLDEAQRLNQEAVSFYQAGRYDKAIPLAECALAIREQALGPTHPDVAQSLNNLAVLYKTTGNYAKAEPLYQRALGIREQTLGPTDPRVATSLNNLADLYYAQGQYGQAEPRFQRALGIREQALGPTHPDVAQSLNNLGGLYHIQGQYGQAKPLFQRALGIREQTLGPTHPDVATSLNNLGGLYHIQGQYGQAEPLFQRALGIREQTLGPADPRVATSLNNLAENYKAQGQDGQAEPLFQRALGIREQTLGPTHPDVATSLNNLAANYKAQGQDGQAEPLFQRALGIREQTLGPTHPDVATSLTNLAGLYQDQGDLARARLLYERARGMWLAVARSNVALDDASRRSLVQPSHAALRAYLALLATLVRAPEQDPTGAAPAPAAFVVAEQLRGSAAQAALAQAGARVAAADPTTEHLARQVQELRGALHAIHGRLTAAYDPAVAPSSTAGLPALRARERDLAATLTAALSQLRTVYPKYTELEIQEPIDVTAVQALLHPAEALVSYVALADRLLIWLVRPDQPLVYQDVPMAQDILRTRVTRMRASLDQRTNLNQPLGEIQPVDLAGAHALYQVLLAPLQDALQGVTHLLVVPDEVLLPLPFGALVTQDSGDAYQTLAERYRPLGSAPLAPTELAAYAQIAWLAKDMAITLLPSATALRAVRQGERRAATAQEPFIGIGDPVLEGTTACRPPPGTMLALRGGSPTVETLRQLCPLPGAQAELLALAQSLGADPAHALYLGLQATKPVVHRLNTAGRLRTAQVLAFSTHGLIAGAVTAETQPALVLTPPALASPEDDGLLRLEDIVQLKLLSTAWVVLSACNTAAGESSEEGLSGLVRAFFFAGAPTLLVSHWSVDDRATQALMTAIFQRYSATSTLARADALQQGMLTMLDHAQGETAYFAHPFAWAAFFLVGEGGQPVP